MPCETLHDEHVLACEKRKLECLLLRAEIRSHVQDQELRSFIVKRGLSRIDFVVVLTLVFLFLQALCPERLQLRPHMLAALITVVGLAIGASVRTIRGRLN